MHVVKRGPSTEGTWQIFVKRIFKKPIKKDIVPVPPTFELGKTI